MHTAGAMQETKRPNPSDGAWGEVTAEVQELLAEHLKTPPAIVEQQSSNITVSWGRPQQQWRATKEPGGE